MFWNGFIFSNPIQNKKVKKGGSQMAYGIGGGGSLLWLLLLLVFFPFFGIFGAAGQKNKS